MPSKVDEVASRLRTKIQDGKYGEGRLPSRDDLALEFKASRDTINKAVALLQAEGLLSPKGQRGVVVSGDRLRIKGITTRFDLEIQKQGLIPYEENIEAPGSVVPPIEVTQALGIPDTSSVIRRYRIQGGLRGERKIPYRLAENFYPSTLIDAKLLQQMCENTSLDVIKVIKASYGKVITHAHEDVIARVPTVTERDLLFLKATSPIIEVQRINYADDNTVVMFNKIIFVANFFTLSYDYSVHNWQN